MQGFQGGDQNAAKPRLPRAAGQNKIIFKKLQIYFIWARFGAPIRQIGPKRRKPQCLRGL